MHIVTEVLHEVHELISWLFNPFSFFIQVKANIKSAPKSIIRLYHFLSWLLLIPGVIFVPLSLVWNTYANGRTDTLFSSIALTIGAAILIICVCANIISLAAGHALQKRWAVRFTPNEHFIRANLQWIPLSVVGTILFIGQSMSAQWSSVVLYPYMVFALHFMIAWISLMIAANVQASFGHVRFTIFCGIAFFAGFITVEQMLAIIFYSNLFSCGPQIKDLWNFLLYTINY